MDYSLGVRKGEMCNRFGCDGIIDQIEDDQGCSCHINPPCSHCCNTSQYCPECNWDNEADNMVYEQTEKQYKYKTTSDLDKSKIDWVTESSSNSFMVYNGCYPDGATKEDVLKEINEKVQQLDGFVYFKDNGFKFIAYTD